MKLETFLMKRNYHPVPMVDNLFGHYSTPIVLDGRQEDFIVDTGATSTVIDETYARKMGYELVEMDGFGGGVGNVQMSIFVVDIDSLDISGFVLEELKVIAMDLSHVKETLAMRGAHLDINGIIGSDILKTYHAVIDYGSCTLFLKDE